MELKKEYIGAVIYTKGVKIKIEDNPDLFEYYKSKGLDVFKPEKKKTKKSDDSAE